MFSNEDIERGKTLAFISYLTIFGLVIGLIMNNESKNPFTAFHVRQSLGLWGSFFLLGYFIGIFDSWNITFAFWIFFGALFIYGFFCALTGKAIPVPLFGKFYQKLFEKVNK